MKRKQSGLIGLIWFLALAAFLSGSCILGQVAAANEDDELLGTIMGTVDQAVEQAMQGIGLAVEGWPAGKVPEEVPPYTRGTVVNSSGSEEEYFIIVETTKDDLDIYLEELEELGWHVDHDRYHPSARWKHIELRLQFNSLDILQMIVAVKDLGEWPYDDVPEDIFPPEKGTLIGHVQIFQLGDEGDEYVLSYEYEGLNEEDVTEYMRQFLERGWDGDEWMIYRSVEWNGSSFYSSMEPWWDEGFATFYFNFFKE